MVLKQAISVKCVCGSTMEFPEGEIKAKCQTKCCLAQWEIGPEGFWSVFVPIIAKPKKLNHYEKYMAWRNKNRKKRRKRK
ncbi:hypothetical protein [Desulfosporosinus hippei]|uniref:Uncharacterized protein n=1 Tax=Desulfosporosinus hippei DSM 8344 TaxID=1121419 RepID=A0A1G7UNY6_9FIRM|nr:hypothetical protein [Desulfosporosinus hippei]SDG48440.1 hypothetical protein SAMN05443529_103182 [Desulfosporosinus hippei DSM 8344]